jgi:uncharacterized protein YggU (UPF0235/DUF167 family)
MKIRVEVHPGAKSNRVIKNSQEVFQVYTTQPARDNRANEAVTKSLSEYLGVNRNRIWLVSGAKAKRKVFELTKK